MIFTFDRFFMSMLLYYKLITELVSHHGAYHSLSTHVRLFRIGNAGCFTILVSHCRAGNGNAIRSIRRIRNRYSTSVACRSL